MGGARALIASLGASFSLVAGAALSLLVVSFVFAYDGFSGGVDVPAAGTALVVESEAAEARTAGGGARRTATPVVIAPAPASTRPAARVAPRPSDARTERTTAGDPAFNPRVRNLNPTPPASAGATPAERPPAVGDGVRDVGDAVSATVQGTGKSARDVTAPLLGPPVAQAVQDVLDLLTKVLERATGALGGVLDTAVPR